MASAQNPPMTERFVTRGFVGRREPAGPAATRASRIPPGQYLTTDFPVLSAGPTPRTPLDRWSFTIEGLVREPVTLDVGGVHRAPEPRVGRRHQLRHEVDEARHALARRERRHAARGRRARRQRPRSSIAYSDGGYTTNLPLADVLNGQAFVAWEYDGKPLAPEHGGPARLVVPARYFWKSAKWVRGLRIQDRDEPGFWESLGYHNRGDQWLEERYSGD